LLAATQAIAELRAELAKTREAAAQAKAALEQDADGLKRRLAAALAQKLADDAEQEDVRAKLAAALAAKLAAERTNADQMTEAETRDALLSNARATLSKEKKISVKAQKEVALLNQQVAALRTQLQNLQGILDDAMAKDIAEEVELQNLGSQLNSALARVAAEERKRRRLEEAERKRLEREATATPSYPSGFQMTSDTKTAILRDLKPCWTVDLGSLSADIVVTLRWKMSPDGKLVAGSLRVIDSEGGDGSALRSAVQIAKSTVFRCGNKMGANLPPEKYDEWQEIEVRFDPSEMRTQ